MGTVTSYTGYDAGGCTGGTLLHGLHQGHGMESLGMSEASAVRPSKCHPAAWEF